MFFLTQLACFFLIFLIIYIILRAIIYYAFYLFLTRIFNAKVKFRFGYSFLSIQDISIDSEIFEIRCKLFKLSIGVHTNMQIRKLQIRKGDIRQLKDVYLDAQRIVDRAFPSKRFFHISIDIDQVDYQIESFSLSMENIHSIHTDSQHSFLFSSCNFSNHLLTMKISEYKHSIHFSGSLPEKVMILHPIFNIKCDKNSISSEHVEVSAYSETPSIWRTVISIQFLEVNFPTFVFTNDIFIVKFSNQIVISLTNSMITFESLHIKNYLGQFKIKVSQVKLRHDKIKIKNIIGNSHVQFLRILNHLRWLLYASCKIKKTELLIELDNGELCDIVVLNFEERSKIDNESSNNNDQNKNLDRLNSESDELNFRYFNIFNHYFNSFNKHNSKLIDGESLVTNPKEIADAEFDRNRNSKNLMPSQTKKELVKADEVKMEMIAHRTIISSVHMSSVQISRQNKSEISLKTLNVVYSNSDTFKLYCQELFDGLSGKLTAKKHNIRVLVKSLRIDELILQRTLTSENLDLKFSIDKSLPLEETRRSLKSLFPKLVDLSKIQSTILINFDINGSEMNFAKNFSAKTVNYSGKMAVFYNGTKLLTCGVVHCISDQMTILMDNFISPAFWYVSFESNTLKIKNGNKKAVFKSIKGESTSFTFESASLYKDVIQDRRQKNLNGTTNSSMNMNYEDSSADDKSASLFDFCPENTIPISVDANNANSSNSTADSLNILPAMANISTESNLNLSTNSNMFASNAKPQMPKTGSIDLTRRLNWAMSQFEFEDSMFRPSQYEQKDNQSAFVSSKENLSRRKHRQYKVSIPTDQISNSVRISPNLTSEYVPCSLFESSASLLNTSRSRNITIDPNSSTDAVSPLAKGEIHDFSNNIQISELTGDAPFFEIIRHKFECFNGEYFTNPNGKTGEFKTQKAVFGEAQYKNVTSRFRKQKPETFFINGHSNWSALNVKIDEKRFIFEYYDPKDQEFDEKKKYELNISPIFVENQTMSFHDMLEYIFNYLMDIVRKQIASTKNIYSTANEN